MISNFLMYPASKTKDRSREEKPLREYKGEREKERDGGREVNR